MTQIARQVSQFAQDVKKGLTATPKYLPSKYLYDVNGDRLFQRIMALPEYYVTRAEYEVFKFQSTQIIRQAVGREPLQLIELGAGDGMKTQLLLTELLKRKVDFSYYPIDISSNALKMLSQSVRRLIPQDFPMLPLQGDYFEALNSPQLKSDGQKLILFLGSTIGNFSAPEAAAFLARLSSMMERGDKLLVGFDLKKHPQTILNAYNDKQGVTRDFNLNLLTRMNKELGANFDLSQFAHFPVYDPVQGAAKSYLVSLKEQEVYCSALRQRIFFKAWESIFMEVSQKFDMAMIQDFAHQSQLRIVRSFTDSRMMYADVLFEKS